MLQGPLTNLDNVREMMNSVHSTGGGECEVVNYTKSGSPYLAKVQVIPSKYLPSLASIFLAPSTGFLRRMLTVDIFLNLIQCPILAFSTSNSYI